MKENLMAFFTVFLLCLFVGQPVRAAEEVIVDLAEHEVAIDLGFNGTNLLIFGVVGKGDDAVIVVRGPERTEIVRRKERVGGIWVNGEEHTFINVPSFYALAVTSSLDEIIEDQEILRSLQIGAENIELTMAGEGKKANEVDEFRKALLRNKQKQRLYTDHALSVNVISDRLFRTSVHLPSNVTIGTYVVSVYEVKKGKVVGQQDIALSVNKVGVEASVFDYSRDYAALYGITAILIALLFGWAVTLVFRRV